MKITAAILSAALLPAFAPATPAGKFSANWANNEVKIATLTDNDATELLATIKPPGGKSVLIGLSGEINILTNTVATGKNKGGSTEAEAMGMVDVTIKYALSDVAPTEICDTASGESGVLDAAPGTVTLSARRQKLTVELDLDCELSIVDETCTIDGNVTVGLELETTAAHHFNFIATDLESAEYYVVACFSLSGSESDTTDYSTANGHVAIRNRMLTVQQVQASQNGVLEPN